MDHRGFMCILNKFESEFQTSDVYSSIPLSLYKNFIVPVVIFFELLDIFAFSMIRK